MKVPTVRSGAARQRRLGLQVALTDAIGLVAAVLFFVLGDALAILREANSMYAHAVADGVVSTPTLDLGAALPPTSEAD
jgi:hypothetical protein